MATAIKNPPDDTKSTSQLSVHVTSYPLQRNGVTTTDLPTDNSKDTLCRNVRIYGKCRYEDKGKMRKPRVESQVTDWSKDASTNTPKTPQRLLPMVSYWTSTMRQYSPISDHADWYAISQAKKTLNVDSPSFTPSLLSPNVPAAGAVVPPKKLPSISPKAASAAPFMPKAIISSMSAAD